MADAPAPLGCRGACGAKQPDDEAASQAGWSYLQITRGWRCGKCERELREASAIVGMGDGAMTVTDPTDRGALRKETASTILPASVKG